MGRQQVQTNSGVLTAKGFQVKPAQTGITRSTQTSPKKISQTGGTQTTPPPSPGRPTGETQTTPLQNNIQDQRIHGQPECNHISEDPPANNTGPTLVKVGKTGKSQHMRYHLDLGHQQEDLQYPGQTSTQET